MTSKEKKLHRNGFVNGNSIILTLKPTVMNLHPPTVLQQYLTFARLSTLLACSFFIFNSCNSGGNSNQIEGAKMPDSSTIKTANWIALNIKFKAGTSREMRDASVNAVKQILIDTINQMRQKGDSNYFPEIVTRQNPMKDSNSLAIAVTYTLTQPLDTPKKPCTCANGCQICSTALLLAHYSPGNPIEKITIVDILSEK